jgi:LmbE family N-acetylglucosaminyl deacetylase
MADEIPVPGPGIWDTPQCILVVLAHPDDPEFFCGGTLHFWTCAGHQVDYFLLTCGDKGFNDSTAPDMTPDALCATRHKEQLEAAGVIGAGSVHWLERPDGYLVPDIDLRREVTRAIRRFKPTILMTCDPQTQFTAFGINHPDHRAAGQAALDAVYPAAGNKAYFPELIDEGLEPHMPREVWISLTNQPNTTIDITVQWPAKMEALLKHASQVGDPEKFKARMLSRHTGDSTDDDPRFEEKFRVVKYV